jgi:hypothetical protein
MTIVGDVERSISRRRILQFGAAGAGALVTRLDQRFTLPNRVPHQTPSRLPEIQFAIGDFLAPVRTIDGVGFRFGPTYTQFLPARLRRTPTMDERNALDEALDTIEATYAFAPDGVFTIVSYGIPYFRSLPASLVRSHIPRLNDDAERFAFEEAQASPTDVAPFNPDIQKARWHVPVSIEANDLLFTIRSDDLRITREVMAWLGGSDRLGGARVPSPPLAEVLAFDEPRLMFVQPGMPRQLADAASLPYAGRINPDSPMWMGFADQQVDATGPADIATFQGNASASLTNVTSDDYFFNGAVQHLSHVILDLEQFYLAKRVAEDQQDENDNEDETYLQRVQYMFRSTPPPSNGFDDQLTDGGGPAFLPNDFLGPDDAARGAAGRGTPKGEPRIGHVSALQRSSRAADGTAMHVRVDGPGYDALDVPDGSPQPKLEFSIFVPTARFFADMRRNQASVDLIAKHKVDADNQGLERFLTTTRRQNFLVPPRRFRAFPLLELIVPPDQFRQRRRGPR